MTRTAITATLFCSLFMLSFATLTEHAYPDLNAILWMQTSVEYRASTIQTYRLAREALLEGLRKKNWTAALEQYGDFENLPPAVILDLDETILDNTAFHASLVLSGKPYSDEAWSNWVDEKRSRLVPGAMDFLQFADAHGVVPLYITNRACDSSNKKDPTVQLLHNLHVPLDPTEDHLFCAKTAEEDDKTERRRLCSAKYRILLLLGDQLEDFLQIPKQSASLQGRENLFVAHQSFWGKRWFQLPNPMYGSWERAVGYSLEQKLDKLRR